MIVASNGVSRSEWNGDTGHEHLVTLRNTSFLRMGQQQSRGLGLFEKVEGWREA